jgi:hypothetical protein
VGHLFELHADTAAAPSILQQPVNNVATTNEDIAFGVVANGTPPLTFQWLFNGAALTGATNSSLLMTNLAVTQSGNYSVTVANSVGSVTSSNATLVVETNIVHRLGTGRILQNGNTAAVPISFRSNGRETSVSFSLSYDANVFSNPIFTPGDTTAQTTVDSSQPGVIGVTTVLGGGRSFPSGYQWLGLVRFDVAAGKDPLAGGLSFASSPVPVTAVNLSGQSLIVLAAVLPQYALRTPAPVLNPQSGLFEHRMLVSNPGAVTMTNIDVYVLSLGFDSVSNAITFFNGGGLITNWPYADPLVDVGCNCNCGLFTNTPTCTLDEYLACGNGSCALDFSTTNMNFRFGQMMNLAPGESRLMTIEFYVSDHFTVPASQYSIFLADPITLLTPANVVPFAIDSSRYLSNSFLVEFSTKPGHSYWIQYADSPTGLPAGPVVFPFITGTGSRVQWIDNGPPKTASPPTNGFRFYRVLSSQ